jgi:hypothetical protein
MNSIIAAIVAALVSGLVLWITFAILRRVFRRIGRAVGEHANIFGATLSARLVSLGVVALILPRVVSAVIEAPVRFVLAVFYTIFTNLNRVLLVQGFGPESSMISERGLAVILDALQKTIWEVTVRFNSFAEQISLASLVLALALWVIVGQLLDLVLETAPQGQLSKGRLIGFFERLPQPQGGFANDTLETHWENLLRNTKQARDNNIAQRQPILAKWETFRQEVWSRKEKLMQSAASGFESKRSTMGRQEQDFYFSEVYKWYRENLDEFDRRLSKAQLFIVVRDGNWKTWAENVKTSLEAALSRLQSPQVSLADLSYITVYDLYSSEAGLSMALFDAQEVFALPAMDVLPQPPKPGSQWGIFGLIAGWLLKTRALSLVLITGMLGFGLFGAAISSVVREQVTRAPGEPLVKDLANVVVRGLSAAVVVFLAVEGGVAIFTTSDPQPNPYVLFFTCLVGAVFSERVWEWARERLNQNLVGGASTAEAASKSEKASENEPEQKKAEETKAPEQKDTQQKV